MIKIKPTRIYYNHEIKPSDNREPILIDNDGFIYDGHHRYYSHLYFGTPLSWRVIEILYDMLIPLEKLLLTSKPHGYYDSSDIEEILRKAAIVVKVNGVYRVVLGNTKIYQAGLLGLDRFRCLVIE